MRKKEKKSKFNDENIEKSIDYFIEKPYYIFIGVYHSMLKGCIKN